MSNNSNWRLVGHSFQIADTGDYDGFYELTDGKIAIFTRDDEDESLNEVINALNDSGCGFYLDDWFEHENRILQDQITQLKAELTSLRERDLRLTALEQAGVDNWEGYNIAVDIFDELNG